ncbi:hypothetical protein FCH83_16350 [Pseudomonas putida]|nr:hypothetical protein [Pseudomonas putida]NTZ26294.1 hypothetical protein [Pseudomonas putida]NTZ57085.1 hypothetical protein [Pseudomonas putida]NTZ65513.1 hypothetical protein [Pseudomonas putida]NTZ78350.1 hypothetical protein [Pseudomonas putida]
MQGFGVVAQYLGRQQQGRAVEIALELGIWLAGHQYRSLAALNALAIRTGVIVILTIPDLTKKLCRYSWSRQKCAGPVVRFIYPNAL